jgi:hypothetical protein
MEPFGAHWADFPEIWYFSICGFELPIPVAVRSKAWDFGRSLTGIVGSNPTEGMDVCVVLDVWTIAWNTRWHAGQKGLQQYKWIKGENPGINKKKSCLGHGCLSLVSVVSCQVEVSVTNWSLVQRSSTECGVSKKVWSWNLEKWGGLGPQGAVEPLKKNIYISIFICFGYE